MMDFPYALAAIGLILIFLEFFLPGAVLGTLGGLFILLSWMAMASSGASLLEMSLFFLGTLFAIYFLIRFALWKIPRTTSSYSIYLKGDQEGYVASSFDASAIGKKGIVYTDLKPGGYILIEGKQHQAISESGYITKGEGVIVIGGDGESLIVKSQTLS